MCGCLSIVSDYLDVLNFPLDCYYLDNLSEYRIIDESRRNFFGYRWELDKDESLVEF